MVEKWPMHRDVEVTMKEGKARSPWTRRGRGPRAPALE